MHSHKQSKTAFVKQCTSRNAAFTCGIVCMQVRSIRLTAVGTIILTINACFIGCALCVSVKKNAIPARILLTSSWNSMMSRMSIFKALDKMEQMNSRASTGGRGSMVNAK
ncbi:hypothetical protein Vafri_15920 [Volvox africanus]|uniref:Uncharacterized protein n=1 Tax=Volvox africanus TaxID=51714 RepID=A0A8J4F963_9CHLO|nr:hypothetical protein Vafri_15920 [Volvox africanus]